MRVVVSTHEAAGKRSGFASTWRVYSIEALKTETSPRRFAVVHPEGTSVARVGKLTKNRSAVAYANGKPRVSDWVDFSDEELLEVRLCDLGLRIERTSLEKRIDRLWDELQARGIPFRPHCWLSDEWFSPDEVPGIGIPFYMAHPRLARLERKQILEVEGGTEEWCMRILRHEAGHAVDSAYRLHWRRSWRETFGKYSQTYPDYYDPKPYSRSFVLHLDQWYASRTADAIPGA